MTAHLPAGSHLLADLYGVAADKLRDERAIEAMLLRSARAAGASVLSSHFHRFGAGEGVTGVVVLAESHITIHTWPEHGFAAADIFMCGNAQPRRALECLLAAFGPASSQVKTVERGAVIAESCDRHMPLHDRATNPSANFQPEQP